MADRNNGVTPMDFEYDRKSNFAGDNTTFGRAIRSQTKRTHSQFDSPTKSKGFQTPDPNRVRLRDPASQTFFFDQSNASKPLPETPSSKNTIWQMRTPKSVVDSSGGETPNTPDYYNNGADSEATPDGRWGPTSKKFISGGDGRKIPSPKKPARRESIFDGFKSMFSSSPRSSRDYYSTKGESRVMKRRQKGINKQALAREFDLDDSDEEEDRSRRLRKKGSRKGKDKEDNSPNAENTPKQSWGSYIGSLFSYLETHPDLPHVLSFYAQLIFNFFLVGFAIYLIYSFWHAVTDEVNIQAMHAETDILSEIQSCATNYRENKCDRSTRVPAMENACSNWESCMQRDPKKVARASVSAKTFAQIFNSFVEEFSYKSMFFTAIIIFGGLNFSNWAFGLFRSKHIPSHDSSFAYPPPPATPQRFPSGGFIDQQGYYTPYGSVNQHMLASQSMPNLAGGEPQPSPMKKLGFR